MRFRKVGLPFPQPILAVSLSSVGGTKSITATRNVWARFNNLVNRAEIVVVVAVRGSGSRVRDLGLHIAYRCNNMNGEITHYLHSSAA